MGLCNPEIDKVIPEQVNPPLRYTTPLVTLLLLSTGKKINTLVLHRRVENMV